MKKRVKNILTFILLSTILTACTGNTDTPIPVTDDITGPITTMPSVDVPVIENTIFTRDVSKEEKEKAIEQLYITVKENFSAWNTFTFEDWNEEYPSALERVLATNNVFDFYMELKRFVTLLNDHHSEVSFPSSFYEDLWITPIQFSYIDDAYYILGGAADVIDRLPQYSRIVKIDDVPIDTFMENNIFPYIWHGKLNTASSSITYLSCLGQMNTSQSFEVITPSGETAMAEIERVPENNVMDNWIPYRMSGNVKWGDDVFSSDLLTIIHLEDDYIYVYIPHFNDKDVVTQFEAYLDVLKEAKGIIIDVRRNQGGNSAYAAQIARHFINGNFPDLYAEESVYDIETDSYTLHEIQLSQIKGIGDITVPVTILQDYQTYSAGEHFLDFMDSAQNAASVGTENAGATGDPKWVPLPEDGNARISNNKISRHDKTSFLNIGIQPNIFVDNSINDYINQYDRILGTGLTELKKMCNE